MATVVTSQNGWPVLAEHSPLLHKWVIPGTDRHLILREGSAGFLLAHFVLWFHEKIERLDQGTWDEWGYAYRPVRGFYVWSNHASGTAADLNATRHPLGLPTAQTFTPAQVEAIHRRLRRYRGAIHWGGDYTSRPDAMHFELDKDLEACEAIARRLVRTPRGLRVLKANPGQRAVIRS